ncbi:carbohydrate ABC transporter permease [Gryllotalpicola reticulitermitis]|uniref:Carbohydrate ABC transporter permease n=1 Tax=Gryllotalpicola reticulitermitis TaxID=1184153 RepID=A0ABV8Q4R6_9MICO
MTTATDQERSLISPADRKRGPVRISLLAIQIVVLAGLVIAGIGPIAWLLKAALSTTQDSLRRPLALFPSGVHWQNVVDAWTVGHIGQSLLNTLLLALGSLVANLIVATTAAYVLSILRPKWGGVLSAAILATLFIPSVVPLVPLYLTIVRMPVVHTSLLNTYWAVWLPAAANAFNTVVIKRFFDSLPPELFEAAKIDGAGAWRVFTLIVLPLSRPILGVVSLLTVIASWKDYLWPLLVLQNPSVQPLAVALPTLTNTTTLAVQMAALALTVLIPIVLFLVFQRQFLRGVGMSGGVKG